MPQGSVLSPLLFLLYVNDIASIIDCTAKMFADDTKIYWSVAGQKDSWQRPPSPLRVCLVPAMDEQLHRGSGS